MATDMFTCISIIILVFVGISLSCNESVFCTTSDSDSSDHCILNSNHQSQVENCCSNSLSVDSQSTMMFTGLNSKLVLANLTFENCTKPIIIEHMMIIEITNVTFRYS